MKVPTKAGRFHEFDSIPIEDFGSSFPGVYAFVRMSQKDCAQWIYVGQSVDVRDRLSNHERMIEVGRHRPTHCYVSRIESVDERKDLARTMIDRFSPVLNIRDDCYREILAAMIGKQRT